MSIKLKIDGFENILNDIKAAGGSMNKACDSALRQSAHIMQSELKAQMQESNVPNDLIEAMPQFEIESDGNQYSARVGYLKGAYNPDDISDGYKVVFLNYGTPNRTKHGKVVARGFIQRAKQKANRKIKKAQNEAFQKILERLSR